MGVTQGGRHGHRKRYNGQQTTVSYKPVQQLQGELRPKQYEPARSNKELGFRAIPELMAEPSVANLRFFKGGGWMILGGGQVCSRQLGWLGGTVPATRTNPWLSLRPEDPSAIGTTWHFPGSRTITGAGSTFESSSWWETCQTPPMFGVNHEQ